MEIHKILDDLQAFSPLPIKEWSAPAYIETHKMIKPGQTSFNPACLYVGYVSELPKQIQGEEISNIICIDDAPLSPEFLESADMNLYLVAGHTNQFDVLNRIADRMIDEATLTSAMRRILDALYANDGLQHIVDVASAVFENPIFVNDTAYKLLALSHKTVFRDETLEAEKKLGYIHESRVEAMRRDGRLMDRVIQSDGIVDSHLIDKNENWLFNSVKINDIVVAIIAIVDHDRPFRQLDHELLHRFTQIVAIEMEKNPFYKDNKGVMYNYLLADLFGGKIRDQRTLVQRIKYLNWKMYTWFQVIVIMGYGNDPLGNKIQLMGDQIRQILPDCRWTVYEKRFVVFLSRPRQKIFSTEEHNAFSSFNVINKLTAGFSDPFTNLVEASRYYQQAVNAADTGYYISGDRGVFTYSEVMVYYLAAALSKSNDLRDFCPPEVATIQQYDKNNNSNLLRTLDSYFHHVGNPVAAAQDMSIHRNTLLYRINKIKELTGLDLNDGNERLKLQLYLRFLEYQKEDW